MRLLHTMIRVGDLDQSMRSTPRRWACAVGARITRAADSPWPSSDYGDEGDTPSSS